MKSVIFAMIRVEYTKDIIVLLVLYLIQLMGFANNATFVNLIIQKQPVKTTLMVTISQ